MTAEPCNKRPALPLGESTRAVWRAESQRRSRVTFYHPPHPACRQQAARHPLKCVPRPMLIARYAKIIMSLSLAAFCLLVTFDNIADYGTNYLFVQHVMSMDTTFPGNTLIYRSITDPVLWQLAYALVIAAEGVTGIPVSGGRHPAHSLAERVWRRVQPRQEPHIAGCLLAFLVWFLGFMVVAGEWFDMWQSKDWNGQDAAFRFYVTVLGVLIFVSLPDADLAPASARRRRGDFL